MSDQRQHAVGRDRFGGRHRGRRAGIGAEIERAENVPAVLRRIARYLAPYRRGLVLVTVLVAVTSGLSLLSPYLTSVAIDHGIIPGNLPLLARVVGWMLGVYLLVTLGAWLQTVVMIHVAQRSVRDLRRDLFECLQTLAALLRPPPARRTDEPVDQRY